MITDLRLQHFRSYADASFELGAGVNIIAGPNASGKTNLLEAVLVLALGKSYRAKDAELVRFGRDWSRLDASLPAGARTAKIEPSGKTFIVDEQELARLNQQRTLPAVLFEPGHLLLFSGSPELRRSFLDDLIEQTQPGYSAVRRHYKRVLAQRNALLKKNPPGLNEQLFVWNVRLSELGGKIAAERQKLLGGFREELADIYNSLSGGKNSVEAVYSSPFPPANYETALLHKLEQSSSLDALRGFTAYGPHRDDMVVFLGGHAVQESASRGEMRTLVLALKILELRLLEHSRGQKPLLLLDDVFSELDSQRRAHLTKFARDYQAFITTTDADIAARHFAGSNIISTTA